jgi:hypothetical protein
MKTALEIFIQTLTPKMITACLHRLSHLSHRYPYILTTLNRMRLPSTAQSWKVMLFYHYIGTDDIWHFVQLYKIELVTFNRWTTSTSQVMSESEQDWSDIMTCLSHDHMNRDCFLPSLTDIFLDKVNNISSMDSYTFEKVKNKLLLWYSAGVNGDSAYHLFNINKNKKSKKETISSGSSSSKSPPSILYGCCHYYGNNLYLVYQLLPFQNWSFIVDMNTLHW